MGGEDNLVERAIMPDQINDMGLDGVSVFDATALRYSPQSAVPCLLAADRRPGSSA
jgi:hypothetical protein